MENIEKIIKNYNDEIEEKFKRHTGILLEKNNEMEENFKRHTGVLLEKFEDFIRTVAEGFSMLSDKSDRLETKVDRLEVKTDTLSGEMAVANIRLDRIETKVKSLIYANMGANFTNKHSRYSWSN